MTCVVRCAMAGKARCRSRNKTSFVGVDGSRSSACLAVSLAGDEVFPGCLLIGVGVGGQALQQVPTPCTFIR